MSATDGSRCSKSKATIIRRSSNPTRAPRPAWAESCATFSAISTRDRRRRFAGAFRRVRPSARATCSAAWSAESVATATASASPRSAASCMFDARLRRQRPGQRLLPAASRGAGRICYGRARKVTGNPVLYVGAEPPGATASTARRLRAAAEFDGLKRGHRSGPTVQVGDPFTGQALARGVPRS